MCPGKEDAKVNRRGDENGDARGAERARGAEARGYYGEAVLEREGHVG